MTLATWVGFNATTHRLRRLACLRPPSFCSCACPRLEPEDASTFETLFSGHPSPQNWSERASDQWTPTSTESPRVGTVSAPADLGQPPSAIRGTMQITSFSSSSSLKLQMVRELTNWSERDSDQRTPASTESSHHSDGVWLGSTLLMELWNAATPAALI